MKIVVIEDESRIARRIVRLTTEFFGDELEALMHFEDLIIGMQYLQMHPVDLLLLDLNLNGADGFQLLARLSAASFQTIIISAYQERAITAFEYGVLDFVPKPFNRERLAQAFQRLTTKSDPANYTKYLAIQKRGRLQLIPVESIIYLQGAGNYTELNLENGLKAIHDKSIGKLQQLLPNRFVRIHKSYLVDMNFAKQLLTRSGSKYAVLLQTGAILPIGRTRYKAIKERWLL